MEKHNILPLFEMTEKLTTRWVVKASSSIFYDTFFYDDDFCRHQHKDNEEGKCTAIVTGSKTVLQRIKALEKKMIIMLS